MIIHQQTAEIIEFDIPRQDIVTGGFNTQDFTLWFHMVRTLYPHKWKAVLRELVSNALDEHDKYGITRPIQVFGPTLLLPQLVIRDFARGLGRKQLEDMLLNLGSGTKRQDDNQRGGFGLGAKSWFAVSDTAMFVSIQNHQKMTYSMGVGPDPRTGTGEAPISVFLGSCWTDEPDGLEITIPVDPAQIAEVNEQIRELCWRFDPQPETNVQLRQPVFAVNHPLFRLRKETDHNRKVAQAIVGNIAYALDRDSLPGESYSTPVGRLLSSPIDIVFAIGEVAPALNREGLSYTPMTIANVTARCNEVIAILKQTVEDQIAAQPNLWEAKKFWVMEIPGEIRNLLEKSKPQFQGKDLTSYFELSTNSYTRHFCHLSGKDAGRVSLPLTSRGMDTTIDPRKPPLLVWHDSDAGISVTKASARLKEWGVAKYGDKSNILVITCTDLEIQGYLAELGGATLDASITDLPDPYKAPKVKSAQARRKLEKFHTYHAGSFFPVEVDTSVPGLFVKVRKWELDLEDRKGFFPSISTLALFCREVLKINLICIPASFSAKSLPAGWANALDHISTLAQQKIHDTTLVNLRGAVDALAALDSITRKAIDVFGSTPPKRVTSPIGKLYAEARRLKVLSDTYMEHKLHDQLWRGIFQGYEITPTSGTFKTTLPVLEKAVQKKYPLMENIYRSYQEATEADWVNYFNALV